jgi:hypothetical protein
VSAHQAVDQPQTPLLPGRAWSAVWRATRSSARLLGDGRVHLPGASVGTRIGFVDGTHATVYRETVVDRPQTAQACALVVMFRLRLVRGPLHTAFEAESLVNTPLFVGFPGFVSKLWLAHDDHGRYRGIYEWDGAEAAVEYARSLWRVLALVSEGGSIGYRVFPGVTRDQLLRGDLVQGHRSVARS